MALLLLDTTVLIDVSKGFEPTTRWLKQRSEADDDLGVCPITVAEFYTGLTAGDHPAWSRFFASMVFCPISLEASIQAGAWRSIFRARGVQLSIADALVAAVAIESGATLVTSNIKHYPMPVRLIDPRITPAPD